MGASMTTPSATDRVCPFCPLHCDDLAVDLQSGTARVTSGGCPIVDRYAVQPPVLDAMVGGKAVQRTDALIEAARLLNEAKAPLVGGLAADVDGLREAMAVADKISAVIDHANSDGLFNNLHVLQRRGALYTTPAEVRNRADVAVIFGTDFWQRLPRFFERYFPAGPTLFDTAPKHRKIFVLGGSASLPAVAGADVVAIPADLSKVQEIALVLNAMIAGRALGANGAAGIAHADLAHLVEALKSAAYGVIGWDQGALGRHGDLAVEALYDLIQTINLTHRAAGLPLPGPGHVTGAYQVSLWQAGTTLRSSFADGKPHYDPRLFRGQRQIEDGRVDTVLWLAAMPDALPTAPLPKPWILVSAFAPPDGMMPDVFIPIAIPARDHASVLFRGEGVVTVHATPWASRSTPPSAAQTLSTLAQMLTEREAQSC